MKKKSAKTPKKQNIEVSEECRFFVSNGDSFTSLAGLAKALRKMKKDTYEYHANQEKNDFANWVEDCIKNKKLGKDIRAQKNKTATLKVLSKY